MSEEQKTDGEARAESDYTPETKAEDLGRFRSPESRAKALANLRPPFQVGHAPKGGRRKKDTILIAEVRRQLKQKIAGDPQGRTAAQMIVRSMIVQAIRGNTWAARLLCEMSGGFPDLNEVERPTQLIVMLARNQPRDFGEPELSTPALLLDSGKLNGPQS